MENDKYRLIGFIVFIICFTVMMIVASHYEQFRTPDSDRLDRIEQRLDDLERSLTADR